METLPVAASDAAERRMCVGESIPFFGVHIAALVGVLLIGWSWSGLFLALAFYYLRMFAITAGYHRYFAHRSFRTGRVVQFLFALFGTLAVQQGALFWAGHHRTHHKHSDQPGDVHSPRLDGFYWAHMGWFLAAKHKRREGDDWKKIPDFARFPELRWLDQYHLIPVVTCGADVPGGGLVGSDLGVLCLDHAPVARRVHDQFAGARVRQAQV